MAIVVDQARSWQDYKKAWVNGMKHLHWFKEHRLLIIAVRKNLKIFRETSANQTTSFL